MIQCTNCGQINTETGNFCRFCGTTLLQTPSSNNGNYEYAPPRPYSWKTDEFQVAENKKQKVQQANRIQPLPNPYMTNQPARPQPLVQQQPINLAYGYHCPRCSSQVVPRMIKKISTTGWIVFAVLLVTFFPLFWIGFLIKEDVRICPVCGLQIGK